MPPVPRQFVAAPLAAAARRLSRAASAQTSTIPQDGAGVPTTPTVALPGQGPQPPCAHAPANTGPPPRMLLRAGLALTLIGFGLRLRTADADLH